MRKEVADFIEGAFLSVLANYAFLFGDHVDKDHISRREGNYILSKIVLMNKSHAWLGLAASRQFAIKLASNVLGIDESDPLAEDRANAAMMEMANVLCGHYRTLLLNENQPFEPSLPISKVLDSDEWNVLLTTQDGLCFLIEGEPLFLIFTIGTEC